MTCCKNLILTSFLTPFYCMDSLLFLIWTLVRRSISVCLSILSFICLKNVLSIQTPFVTFRSGYIQRWKLRCYSFHHKDYFYLGQEHSVNWQYTDAAITAMVIKNQELHQLKKWQREAIWRAEPIFVLYSVKVGSVLNKSCIPSCGSTKLLC